MSEIKYDLLALVADSDAEQLLKALLPRLPKSNLTSNFSFHIIRHPNRDNGCYTQAGELINTYRSHTRFGLILFDKEGSGAEKNARKAIERKVENDLVRNGWQEGQIKAIVIEPELESWIWMRNPHIAHALKWTNEQELYAWLEGQNVISENCNKPQDPKKWLKQALRKGQRSLSSAIFGEIAKSVSLKQAVRECSDQSFRDLISTLRRWFPPTRHRQL